jgi:hypothetical protein
MRKKETPSILKNYQILSRLFYNKKKFLSPITTLQKKCGTFKHIKYIDSIKTAFNKAKTNAEFCRRLNENRKLYYQKRANFISTLDPSLMLEYSKDIKDILKINNLGDEWFITIADIIISGYKEPPQYNLAIYSDPERHKLNLEIGPNTSLADVVEAWGYIKSKQQKNFNKTKKSYYSKKYPENSCIIDTYLKLKEQAIELNYSELVADTYKKNDIDIMSNLFPDTEDDISFKADKRRVNRVRQIKHRLGI